MYVCIYVHVSVCVCRRVSACVCLTDISFVWFVRVCLAVVAAYSPLAPLTRDLPEFQRVLGAIASELESTTAEVLLSWIVSQGTE